MLFLLNDRVLKTAGGKDLITKVGLPLSFATQCSTAQAVLAMQTAFLEDPNLPVNNPDKAAALAWLLSGRTGANSAMFIYSCAKPKHPHEVAYRLATTSLTILGALNALQEQGKLNTRTINENVWAKAA